MVASLFRKLRSGQLRKNRLNAQGPTEIAERCEQTAQGCIALNSPAIRELERYRPIYDNMPPLFFALGKAKHYFVDKFFCCVFCAVIDFCGDFLSGADGAFAVGFFAEYLADLVVCWFWSTLLAGC